jgi:response regulator RpfG family c-di-GMP phosphodiesterase
LRKILNRAVAPIDTWRVLILEDEPIIGLALEDMLQSLGVRCVLLADTLSAATAIVENETLHWAVLDVNIHGERSYAVADKLQAIGTPFIFATGYGDTQHPDQHINAITLIKPYSLSDLKSVIEQSRPV